MIADPTRSRMLAYLLGGECASAGELARAASVAASTTSAHLAQLVQSGLVSCEARGRHRYFKIADADVAHALEALALVAERGVHQRRWASPGRERLRYARCCYGHLAGALGVALLGGLLRHARLLPDGGGYALTPNGDQWLQSIGLAPRLRRPNPRLAYPCLDWSERRDHLAGSLAVELLAHFIASDWLARVDAKSNSAVPDRDGHRVLRLTTKGERLLLPHLAT